MKKLVYTVFQRLDKLGKRALAEIYSDGSMKCVGEFISLDDWCNVLGKKAEEWQDRNKEWQKEQETFWKNEVRAYLFTPHPRKWRNSLYPDAFLSLYVVFLTDRNKDEPDFGNYRIVEYFGAGMPWELIDRGDDVP